MSGFRVMAKQCQTCIFGPKSPIPESRFEELKTQWSENNNVQQCHTSNIAGRDDGCRGHYEAARQGKIAHPMNGVFGPMPIEQTMHIAESMGLVEFIDLEKK